MDDIEFRHIILSDPNVQSDAIDDAMEMDPTKKKYADEVRSLNNLIEDAAKVDIPPDLETRLLQQIPMQSKNKPVVPMESMVQGGAANDGKYWQIAAAACFAFIIGLTLNLNMFQPEGGMGAGEYALKNTYQGMPHISDDNEQLALDQVNAKLANYGVQMEQEIGQVYSANTFFCTINEVNVLHLVVAGEAGNISMYVLPKNNKLDQWNDFSDSRFNGKATRYSKADMVIVAEKDEPLRAFQSKVENSMKWRT